jgi:hypothetical protein
MLCAQAFVTAQGPGSESPFFWFDCFSVDEHATQTMPQEWWSTTFQDAIGIIGQTVMMFSPWDRPVTLTRSWCLWELLSTVETGATFSACLAAAEQETFEVELLANPDKVLSAFANIDVTKCTAGSASDQAMILAAAERTASGTTGQNALAVGELRKWVKSVARRIAATAPRQVGADGSSSSVPLLATLVAETTVTKVATVLWEMDEYKEARELDNLVLSTRVARLGQDHPDLAAALGDREVPMEDYWRFCAQSTNTPERRQQPVVGVELLELLDSSSDDDVVVILDQ